MDRLLQRVCTAANTRGAYMYSMPRPVGGAVPSYHPVHQCGTGGGQGYTPSRYPTPKLNQIIQPSEMKRYPYSVHPQQQTSPLLNWPMQQTRNHTRYFVPGLKPLPISMQQQQVRVVSKLFIS